MVQSVYSVEKLKAAVGGFAKGNRYNVLIVPPAALVGSAVPGQLTYLCESVSLPTKGLASNPQDIYSTPREIPYRETFTESALSFYLDDDFAVKNFFDEWQGNIVNPNTGNVNYWHNFTGKLIITRVENDSQTLAGGPRKYVIELLEAYPSVVGEIALGHAQGTDALRLSVTFKYRRWNNISPSAADIEDDF